MGNLVKILLTIAVALASFTTGLGAPRPGPQSLWRQPGQLLRALLAILIAVPLWALLFLEILPLPQVTRSGIFIAVLSIGIGPIAGMKRLQGSSAPTRRAFELNVTMLLASIVYVPLMVALLAVAFHRDLSLGMPTVAKIVFFRALIPLALGMLVARAFPRVAEKLQGPLGLGLNITVGLIAVVALVAARHQLASLGIGGWLVALIVAAGAVAIGHALGGPQDEMRPPLAVASAMRFPALALLLVSVSPLGNRLVPAVIAYIVSAIVATGVYARLRQRHGRGTTGRHAPTPTPSPA